MEKMRSNKEIKADRQRIWERWRIKGRKGKEEMSYCILSNPYYHFSPMGGVDERNEQWEISGGVKGSAGEIKE